MQDTFRRATRIRALPKVAVMKRKMFKAIKNMSTPGGIFVTTNVPFVLFAIGVESPQFSFMKKKRRFELTFGFFSCKATEDG